VGFLTSSPFLEPLILLSMGLYGIGYGMYQDSWFPDNQ